MNIELFQKPDGSEYLALRILTRTKDGGRGLVRMSFGKTPEEAIRKEEALHEDALARLQSRTVRKHKAVAGRKRQSLKAAEGG